VLFPLVVPDLAPGYIVTHLPPVDGSRVIGTVVVGQVPPYPMPWIWHAATLANLLGIALLVAGAVTWSRAKAQPAAAIATGMVLASVAYPVVWGRPTAPS